ncbi:MAG: beta-ketoacyl-ACP reductase [Candidatus Promineifilaceae bacterium]|nr:beta-ketoacyl-ACP reductase [Candidatus Promineifilaceae bacterium]
MQLEDKVCLITGGAAGIGRATAEAFARKGATVVLCDMDEDKGKEAAAALGEEHAFYRVNVADRKGVQEWVDDVVEAYGRIDVLVNNAGITRDNLLVKVKEGELVKQMPEEEFDLVVDVNLKGVFNCAQAVAPVMIRQGHGIILNASSVVGLDGNFGQTNYVATKAGVVGMTRVWARELGRHGIRVNAVAPGFIATEMTNKMPERVLETMQGHTPLGRLGQPEDVANAYTFLASDAAAFITGAVLRVDGGIVIGT